jgi:feruloyl-CoA synthase
VHVGALRLAALEATTPALQDAVVVGHDREAIGLLAWPNLAGLRQICKDPSLDAGKLIETPDVVDHIRRGLAAHNARNPGSASAIRRVLLLLDPPSIDADEITDKGYINQRAVIEHRKEMVDKLYAKPAASEVIILD